MASGDTLVLFKPSQGRVTIDVLAKPSPDSRSELQGLDFDGEVIETIEFDWVMPSDYAGGGTTVTVFWAASNGIGGTALSGDVVWNVSWRRIEEDVDDLDDTPTHAAQKITDTEASASGEISKAPVTFADGTDMDSVVSGDMFSLRLSRDATNAADTLTGDAEVFMVEVKET